MTDGGGLHYMASMIVRNPTPGEVDAAAEVASKAFPDGPLREWQREFHLRADVFGLRYILVVEHEGQIVSSLICTPAPVWVNGRLVSHSAVGGVGTLPEFRCKGLAGLMMTECVRLLREEGICLSSLWPFSYEYYRKFGWEVGCEHRSYSASSEVLAGLAEGQGVRDASADDFPLIASAYRRFGPSYSFMTDRSHEWWLGVLRTKEQLAQDTDESLRAVLCERDGNVAGYAVYKPQETDGKKVPYTRELMADTPALRCEILAYLGRAHSDSSVTFFSSGGDSFLQSLPNPRLVECRMQPSFQFRLIDPVKSLESRWYGENVSARVSLRIADPVFEQGFEVGLDVEAGSASIVQPDASRMVEVSVQTLAQLYTGYLSPDAALRLGRLRLDDEEAISALSKLFGPLNAYRSGLELG